MPALVHSIASTKIFNQATIDGRQKALDDYDDAYDKATSIIVYYVSDAEFVTIVNVIEDPVATWQKLDTKYKRKYDVEVEATHLQFLEIQHVETNMSRPRRLTRQSSVSNVSLRTTTIKTSTGWMNCTE